MRERHRRPSGMCLSRHASGSHFCESLEPYSAGCVLPPGLAVSGRPVAEFPANGMHYRQFVVGAVWRAEHMWAQVRG